MKFTPNDTSKENSIGEKKPTKNEKRKKNAAIKIKEKFLFGSKTELFEIVRSNVAKTAAMAPALTEPISHRQSKISSPAQASSPRPIIGDITEQTATQNSNIAQNHLANQTNGSDSDSFSSAKDTTNQLNDSQEKSATNQTNQQQQHQQQQQIEDFDSAFIDQISNGPTLGPLFATHMDQSTNDQITNDYHQQEQHQQNHNDHNQQQVPDPSTVDLFNAIAESTNITTSDSQPNSQIDCGNLNAIQPTVDELLAQTQTHDFQQQLQQEFLQQQNQVQNQNFDLTQFPQTSVPSSIDLMMADDQMHQSSGGNAIHNSPMSSQMQNNFLKENAEMEQMLGDLTGTDIDLMQVLKCFESTPAGENLGDLAGSLALFNDVDVMNIGLEDVVGTSVPKESRAQDMLVEIEKKREKMIRECDFMMRRLRKIQARHMGRHISEEIGGVFDYTQQLIKRKERETKSISTMTPINQLHSDKHKLNSATSTKMLLKRIEQAATNQQSSSTSAKILMSHANSTTIDHHANNSSNLSASGSNASAKPSVITCVPAFDANGTQQMKQCAGLLSTELSIIQKSIDSDATASSSGGESADEGIAYNNPHQQPLSIAKRAAYRWARDRAKIASRWTWLLAQISDLEYRIRQHQELYYLLKKSNGPVAFEDAEPMPIVPLDIGSVNGCRNNMLQSNIRIPVTAPHLGNMPNNGLKKLDDDDDGVIITEETVGSARTRAFKRSAFKKRKLLQSTNLHKISRRAARPCTIKCGCRWPVHPCLLCTGRTDPTAPRDLPDMLSTQEGVALLDPCFHPILSFPEDVAQNIHLEATLRQPEWQTRVARVSSKAIIKGALAMQKANERERDAIRNNTNTSTITNRKNADQVQPTIKSKKLAQKKFKLGLDKIKSRNKSNINNSAGIPTERKRRGRKAIQAPIPGKRRKNKLRKNSHLSATSSDHHDMDLGSPNSSISRSKNPSPTPASFGYPRLQSNHRFNKNSYDIDNIVIPSNMSTTIEVLSYKEIPTPKWRVISDNDEAPKIVGQEPIQEEPKQIVEEQPVEIPPVEIPPVEIAPVEITPVERPQEETSPVETPSLEDKTEENQPGEDEQSNQSIEEPTDEDISNEAYAQRHERGLHEERRKFMTFLKFPYSTRSRANRRTDSQADSSGANTPDPMSPAPSTPAPSTNNDESAPPTPQPVDATAEPSTENGKTINNNTKATGNGNGIIQKNPLPPIAIPKQERRRTVSLRKGIDPREELLRRSTTPDVKDTTPPYEPLAFPLPIDTLDLMIQCMPASYKDIINECIDQVTSVDKINEQTPSTTTTDTKTQNATENFSDLPMLAEDSDETESIPEEDPNDPEFEPTPAKRILKGP